MVEIKFNISEDDVDRLFLIKDLQGKRNLTGNDFARELLTQELHRLFPPAPRYDEDGVITNRDAYQG